MVPPAGVGHPQSVPAAAMPPTAHTARRQGPRPRSPARVTRRPCRQTPRRLPRRGELRPPGPPPPDPRTHHCPQPRVQHAVGPEHTSKTYRVACDPFTVYPQVEGLPDRFVQAEGTGLTAAGNYSGTFLLSTLSKDDSNSLRGFASYPGAPGIGCRGGSSRKRCAAADVRSRQLTVTARSSNYCQAPRRGHALRRIHGKPRASRGSGHRSSAPHRSVMFALDVGGANGEVIRAMLRLNSEPHRGGRQSR